MDLDRAVDLQRACEASIDLAMHLVRVDRLGIPKQSRDAIVTRHLDDLLAFASLALRRDDGAGVRS